jgi:hypothetical protein
MTLKEEYEKQLIGACLFFIVFILLSPLLLKLRQNERLKGFLKKLTLDILYKHDI